MDPFNSYIYKSEIAASDHNYCHTLNLSVSVSVSLYNISQKWMRCEHHVNTILVAFEDTHNIYVMSWQCYSHICTEHTKHIHTIGTLCVLFSMSFQSWNWFLKCSNLASYHEQRKLYAHIASVFALCMWIRIQTRTNIK